MHPQAVEVLATQAPQEAVLPHPEVALIAPAQVAAVVARCQEARPPLEVQLHPDQVLQEDVAAHHPQDVEAEDVNF